MLAVADINRRLGILLGDVDFVHFTESELVDWINDAAATIVDLRNQAGALTETHTCVAGPVQRVDAIALFDVTRSLDTNKALTRVSRFQLDSADPDWMADTETEDIIHYSVDDRDPLQFYCYPPASVGAELEVSIARAPTLVTTADGQELDMGREYMTAILNYCAFRALSRDDEYGQAFAQVYLNSFRQNLGLKTQSIMSTSPNRSEP